MKGKAHLYPDNLDTDQILPGQFSKTLDLEELASHVLEFCDPEFRQRMRPGDIVVGGQNFGCGSSREQAPRALKAAGVAAVVASSFARIFFRNAINIGLPLLDIGEHEINQGADLEIDLEKGTVTDLSAGRTYPAAELPRVMLDIMREGGLIAYLKKNGDYKL